MPTWPSFRWNFTVSESPNWHFAFSRFADQITDWRPVFDLIIEDYQDVETKHFQTEGRSGLGQQWADLSPDYAMWKSENYPGRPILVREGDMRQAVLEPKIRKKRDYLRLRIKDEKLEYHQEGTKSMPARPVLVKPETMEKRWMKIFQSYMVYATRSPLAGGLR